jgi:hypothetical protein
MNSSLCLMIAMLGLAPGILFGHHSFAAEYDRNS